MDTKVVQIRGRGTLTLPARMRERYGLADGDPLTVVDLGGVMVLSPKVGVVPKLASEIERMREAKALSVDEMVAAVGNERRRSSKPVGA